MALKFSPNGFLDLCTDPSELPGEALGEKGETSGAMRRCTNLVLDKEGIASTRPGSTVLNDSAMGQTVPYTLIEQNGFRYCFNATEIFKDETSIEDSLADAPWSAIKYNPYNSLTQSIYALNGKDKKRIEGDNVYEWGVTAPPEEARLGVHGFEDRFVAYGNFSEIIRPVAPGDETNLVAYPSGDNYACVDEIVSDGETTFVYNSNTTTEKRDLYVMANGNNTGTINWIKVWMRTLVYTGYTGTAKTAIKVDGTVYEGSSVTLTTSYVDYYTQYFTHPGTSKTWTWSDIDSLQAGMACDYPGHCTQIWVEVNYHGTSQTTVEDSGEAGTEEGISTAGLTGAFNVKYTYARKEEDTVVCESNPSDAVSADKDYAYVNEWEKDEGYVSGTAYNLTTDGPSGIEAMYTWEVYQNDISDSYYVGTYYWEVDHAEMCVIPQRISGGMLEIYCPGPIGDKQATHVRIYRTEDSGITYYHDKDAPLAKDADYSYTHEWERENQHVSGDGYNFTEDYNSDSDHLDDTEGTYGWEKLVNNITDSYSRSTHQWEPIWVYTTTPDLSLGTEVAINHNRPPSGDFVIGPTHEGECFIGKGKNLHYCLPKQPDYFPATYFVEVSVEQFPLIAGCILDNEVYVSSRDKIYKIFGAGEGVYTPASMEAITGTQSRNCLIGIHGVGIIHLGLDGLYLYSGSADVNATEEKFRPIFDGTTVENVPGLNQDYIDNCWVTYFRNKIYFGYPGGTSEYPDNILVTNIKTRKTVHYDYGETFVSVCVDHENDRLLAADTSGYVWELEDLDATDDNGTAISWQIQSKDFSDQLYKYFPRYARYDVTLGTSATATGYVLLDGSSKQSHTLSTSRNTKKRLVTGCNGDRLAMRISGTGTVDIYAAEAG